MWTGSRPPIPELFPMPPPCRSCPIGRPWSWRRWVPRCSTPGGGDRHGRRDSCTGALRSALKGGTFIGHGVKPQAALGAEQIADRVVTGVAHLGKRAQVKVRGVENFHTSGLGARVFQVLAEAHVSVDLIHLSLDYIVFIIDQAKVEIAQQALAPWAWRWRSPGLCESVRGGSGHAWGAGVMARVVNCLSAEDIPIYQTSDSHANISCLILEEDIGRAVQALYREFHLDSI